LPDAELAIESDPCTFTDSMVHQIGSLHFNRASFGVQAFDAKVQAANGFSRPKWSSARPGVFTLPACRTSISTSSTSRLIKMRRRFVELSNDVSR
jgi:hypothetical protein